MNQASQTGGFFMEKFMEYREQSVYLGNVTHSDPTAWEALRCVDQSVRPAESTDPDPKTLITALSCKLMELNKQRNTGAITRKVFQEQRRPLVTLYKAISQVNLEEKGGK